ncbi:MAG: Rieske 2Fe-2S domain-containing protein [Verrucomicrobiales bacterium]|nr:Rieske 2Fe-2S domain-containing protein [Verrucomicrobiales bacterium]
MCETKEEGGTGSRFEMGRRGFFRTVMLGTAVSMVSRFPWQGMAVASVAQPSPGAPGVLRLRLADFPSLSGAFGSVRLGFTNLNVGGPLQPFILSKDGDAIFVVSAVCTHAGCIIPAFSSTKSTTCPCHGSRFSASGAVLRGPATERLPEYEATLDEQGFVTIVVPEFLGFEVTISQVLSGDARRVMLEFLGERGVDYEVRARANAAEAGTVKSFALTPAGAANQTTFRGTGVAAKLYVEQDAAGGAGFLTVAAKVKTV